MHWMHVCKQIVWLFLCLERISLRDHAEQTEENLTSLSSLYQIILLLYNIENLIIQKEGALCSLNISNISIVFLLSGRSIEIPLQNISPSQRINLSGSLQKGPCIEKILPVCSCPLCFAIWSSHFSLVYKTLCLMCTVCSLVCTKCRVWWAVHRQIRKRTAQIMMDLVWRSNGFQRGASFLKGELCGPITQEKGDLSLSLACRKFEEKMSCLYYKITN